MQGVMYDSAQSYYQLSLANQIGDATPTLHLFSSDDTPTAGVPPSSYQELSNDSYAPLPVPDGFWQFLTSPLPPHFGVVNAEWNLGPPGPFGDDTIFGWWLDGFSPRLGQTVGFFGGRFDAPVTIPPAGLVLTLAQTDLYLHDCGTSPPPPPLPVRWLDDFLGATSAPLTSHTPQVGSGYTAAQGTFTVHDLVVSSSSNVNQDSVTFDPGVSDGILNVVLTAQWTTPGDATAPGITFRGVDARNFWLLLWVSYGASWQLYRVVSGGFNLVGSVTRTANGHESTRLEITLASDSISVSADGQAILSTVDSFGQHATVCGLLQIVIGTATSCQWSNLVVR